MMAESAVERELIHTREIVCRSYRRSDGLWDIEGQLRDIRTDDIETAIFSVRGGDPLHHMTLVMTIDSDAVIQFISGRIIAGATPICQAIEEVYEGLRGIRIGSGFKAEVERVVGSVKGCTHLTTLLQAIATAAVQAMWHDPRRAAVDEHSQKWVVDSCHGYRGDGEPVRLMYPAFYRPAGHK